MAEIHPFLGSLCGSLTFVNNLGDKFKQFLRWFIGIEKQEKKADVLFFCFSRCISTNILYLCRVNAKQNNLTAKNRLT